MIRLESVVAGAIVGLAAVMAANQYRDCNTRGRYERCQRVETFDCDTAFGGSQLVTRCDWRCLDAERAP